MTEQLARKFLIAATLCVSLASVSAVRAEGWMFNPSYYSHSPPQPVQVGPRLTGGPFYTRPQGAYINGGYRRLNSRINVKGQTVDNLNVYESWIQYGQQF